MPYGVAVDNTANWNAAKAVITITNIFISDTATGYAFTAACHSYWSVWQWQFANVYSVRAAVKYTGGFATETLPMTIHL